MILSESLGPTSTTSTTSWPTAGVPPGTVLSSAVGAEKMADLVDIPCIELLVIDQDTRLRRFRDEIRGNQADSGSFRACDPIDAQS